MGYRSSAIPVNNDNRAQNEPEVISPESESSSEIEKKEASKPETAQTPVNEPLAPEPEPIQTKSKSSLARQLLITARNAIQFRKRKKLDRVMTLFENKNGSTSSP